MTQVDIYARSFLLKLPCPPLFNHRSLQCRIPKHMSYQEMDSADEHRLHEFGLDERAAAKTLRCTLSTAHTAEYEAPNPASRTVNSSLTVIGRGTCGTVYEIPGSDKVLKLGSPSHDGIEWDSVATNKAYTGAINTLKLDRRLFLSDTPIPRVPYSFKYYKEDDCDFWGPLSKRLPDENGPRVGFVMQRIHPVPEETCRALISLFFHRDERSAAYETVNNTNSACLIRLYFGKISPTDIGYESLWNFELHYDQIRELRLDMQSLVRQIAVGLSVVHWQACLDGRDIEFVLGRSAPSSIAGTNPTRQSTHMWILDFDKTRQFSLEEDKRPKILNWLIAAVHGNDPYYPNPTIDKGLWGIFADTYIKTSQFILNHKGYSEDPLFELPATFIKMLKTKFLEQAYFEANTEHLILFGDDSDHEQAGEGENGWDENEDTSGIEMEEDEEMDGDEDTETADE